MSLYVALYKGRPTVFSVVLLSRFKAYFLIALLILISMIVTASLLGMHYGRQDITNKIKQAIKGNEYKKVEGFEFFTDKKGQAYITNNNYREVADISMAGEVKK